MEPPGLWPQPPYGNVRRRKRLLVPCPLSTHLSLSLSPGVATYTDKLFKFRNNRWEDVLSDDVNVARGVASLFAGRSVACVDRTVSAGAPEGLGGSRGTLDVRARRGLIW